MHVLIFYPIDRPLSKKARRICQSRVKCSLKYRTWMPSPTQISSPGPSDWTQYSFCD